MKPGDAVRADLERRIDYTFRRGELLRTALTHGSAATPTRSSYQRLEFLGDRVLGLIVAEMLVEEYPKATEGELSHRLGELVRKETCAEVATAVDLGSAIRLGGSRSPRSALLTINVLGDACEALIGAIYLDGGLEAARAFVESHWQERMRAAPGARRNPKAALQEWAQTRGLPVPSYAIVTKRGPDHEPHFEVEVSVQGLSPASGEGKTRRDAEFAAATAILLRERVWKDQ